MGRGERKGEKEKEGREEEGSRKTHLSFVLCSCQKDRFLISSEDQGVGFDRVRERVGRDLVFLVRRRVNWGRRRERVSKSLEDLLGCGWVVADEVGVSSDEGPVSAWAKPTEKQSAGGSRWKNGTRERGMRRTSHRGRRYEL